MLTVIPQDVRVREKERGAIRKELKSSIQKSGYETKLVFQEGHKEKKKIRQFLLHPSLRMGPRAKKVGRSLFRTCLSRKIH